MKTISTIADITTLNIPQAIKCELNNTLIEPFNDKEEAETFWDEESCFLILVEPDDTIESLDEYDRDNGHWLDFITTQPESVLLLGDETIYLLALAIICDSGSGGYLLMPISHISSYKYKLKAHINSQ